MIKKTLILFAFILTLVYSPNTCAQQKTGRWTVFPTVGDTFSDVIDNNNGKVYMLTAGKLYHHSLTDNETYYYTTSNKLSDGSSISRIWYNYENKYLLVAYATGNIDLIYDNGKVVNLFEIKDAVLTTGHGINHVSFNNNRIYVATQFGFVVFDDKKYEVIESGIYNENINYIFPMDDYLVVVQETKLYASPLNIRHNQFDKFVNVGQIWYSGDVFKLSENTLFFTHSSNKNCYFYEFNFETNSGKQLNLNPSIMNTFPLVRTKDGMFAQESENYVFIDSERNITKTTIPTVLRGSRAFSGRSNLGSIWVAEQDGLTHYDASESTPTKLMEPFRPYGFTVFEPCLMRYSDDGYRLYVANIGPSYNWATSGDNYDKASYLDILENGEIRDAAVHNASKYKTMFNNYDATYKMYNWRTDAATDRVGSNNRFVEDPDDPSIYYVANNCAGVIVVKDGEIINILNKSNSDVPSNWWMNRTMDVNIDSHGNLWMGTGYGGDDVLYSILPAEKRRDITNVQTSDWYKPIQILRTSYYLDRDTRSLFCKHSNCSVFYGGRYGAGIAVYDDNGTSGNISDDKCTHYTNFVDTEGNSLFYNYINNFAEDHNGLVWVVSEQGLFIMNPTEAQSSSFRIKRPIVPRNDGTNYGDYLLESENIHCVAVDPTNRKWLGTATSGVYLVNADGTEILAHYTTDNSELPSNQVWSVACDPHSNKVYFGTSNGIVCYESDSAPAAEDYSNVYAYPNPVRPDYTGWITVTGLMENSLVKIADVSGKVLFQTRSEGGIVRWDGCGLDGLRVRSGVYLVFASQNENGGSSGAVAKIMVIR